MPVTSPLPQILADGMDRAAVYLNWYARRLRSRERAHRLIRWHRDHPGEAVRYEYPLGADDVVVDLGGFRGDFAAEMVARYGCRVLVFEPVPDFAKQIRTRFSSNPLVEVYEVGLAAKAQRVAFHVQGESSSQFGQGAATPVTLEPFHDVLRDRGIERVDLLKLNIEGGEYELLDWWLDSAWPQRTRFLQVQFHDFVDQASSRRQDLVDRLGRTHDPSFSEPFVWEGWARREPAVHPSTTQATSQAA